MDVDEKAPAAASAATPAPATVPKPALNISDDLFEPVYGDEELKDFFTKFDGFCGENQIDSGVSKKLAEPFRNAIVDLRDRNEQLTAIMQDVVIPLIDNVCTTFLSGPNKDFVLKSLQECQTIPDLVRTFQRASEHIDFAAIQQQQHTKQSGRGGGAGQQQQQQQRMGARNAFSMIDDFWGSGSRADTVTMASANPMMNRGLQLGKRSTRPTEKAGDNQDDFDQKSFFDRVDKLTSFDEPMAVSRFPATESSSSSRR